MGPAVCLITRLYTRVESNTAPNNDAIKVMVFLLMAGPFLWNGDIIDIFYPISMNM
jgi:hypothetical protein